MNQLGRPAKRGVRLRLLAGAAVLACATAALPALSQEAVPAGDGFHIDDGLSDGGSYLEADELVQDEPNQVITARGGVELRYRGRTVRAEELVYELDTGLVTARGEVAIISPDGTAQFADSLVLDEEMRAGVASGFSTRLPGNVKIAAASAIRRSESVNELSKAIYTPCDVCVNKETGEQKGPTWYITADKVVQDRERQIIYYRNARLTLFGAPIFYTPVFWHADPTAGAKSGLLTPTIEASRRRGFSWEQPYLQVISPSQDLVISPQINTKVNPFLNLHWRKRFYSGQVDARVGYTYEQDLRGDGDRFGEKTSRSYILANGAFDLNQFWRWGFAAERTSDDLIFDKYNIGDVFGRRGLFATDDHRLTSQLWTTRQDQRSWFSVSAISIQGLRESDIDRAFPAIAPLVEGRWEPEGPVMGGRLRLTGSAVALTREQSQIVGSTRDTPGIDSRRVTTQADWRRNLTFASGLRVSPFAQVRGDVYQVSDTPLGDEDAEGRLLGVAGVDISMPFFRRDGDRTIIVEPLAQIAVSPEADQVVVGYDSNGEPVYLNEDSLTLELDETNLFRANRFPGFDLYEGGQRLNVGGRVTVDYDDGRGGSVMVGRSFRAEEERAFPTRTGLRDTASDWIVAAEARPLNGMQVFSRARFDSDDATVRRWEVGADVATERASGYLRYMRAEEDANGDRREDMDFAGDLLFTENWGVTVHGVWDLDRDVWRRQEAGVRYRDDCLDLAVVWVHEETFNRSLGPSDSIQVRLTLATLGDKGYTR